MPKNLENTPVTHMHMRDLIRVARSGLGVGFWEYHDRDKMERAHEALNELHKRVLKIDRILKDT